MNQIKKKKSYWQKKCCGSDGGIIRGIKDFSIEEASGAKRSLIYSISKRFIEIAACFAIN